jgi:hypothetical protein
LVNVLLQVDQGFRGFPECLDEAGGIKPVRSYMTLIPHVLEERCRAGDKESLEVHVRNQNGKVTGVAILGTGPREFTVANIVGPVDLDSLADLGGHFGLPRMEKGQKKK